MITWSKMLIIVLLPVLFLISCAPPPAIKTIALVPGRFDEAAKLKEVAVLPFDGSGGRELTTEIEGVLGSVNIHDKQYFSLVDRIKLDKAISEMRLSQSALVDPDTAAKIGKFVGAKGIYTGSITAVAGNDSNYQEERDRCAYQVTKKDKKGREYQECGKWEKYNVSCTKRSASFAFTPKLIEVETSRVVYANNVSGTAGDAVCEDSQKPLASSSELLGKAKQTAKDMFRTDVAPHYVTMEIKLMDSSEGMTSGEAEKKFSHGMDFAKGNRLDRACELWGEVRIFSPNSPAVHYNLGICSEVTGDVAQALDLYKKADRLLNKPDDKITLAISRCTETAQKQKKLREQIGK